MKKAKIFKNGQSQAIRLPKEFRVEGEEVYLNRLGRMTIILPIENPWELFLESLDEFSEDCFEEGRKQPLHQIRESL